MIPSCPDPETGLPVGPVVPGEPARRPPDDLRLEGRTVRLERLDPARHAADLWAAIDGPALPAQFLYLFPPPPPDAGAFRAQLDGMAAALDPFALAILDGASGRAVGHATFMRIEPAHRVIEVGNILFSPALQRSPAATEAMALMAGWAFEEGGYRRYEWKCNALNAPSRRAALRYGFTYEGTFRDHMIVKGRARDTAWFSLLASEWPARRRAFARWLDPANFDAAGRQRVPLSVVNAPAFESGGARLRRAGPGDVAAFDHVHRAAFAQNRALLGREPLPLQIDPGEILARYETWLLEEDGAVAGTLALEPRAQDLLVWSLAVHPDRQNGGTGRRLLAAAESRAAALGLPALRLYTGAVLKKNVDWYARRGYAVERTEAMPDGRAVVHMVKQTGS